MLYLPVRKVWAGGYIEKGGFMKTFSSKRGYTLVEIGVATVTIGILAAAVIPAVMKSSERSAAAEAMNAAKALRGGQERYFLQKGAYASSCLSLDVAVPASLSASATCLGNGTVQIAKAKYTIAITPKTSATASDSYICTGAACNVFASSFTGMQIASVQNVTQSGTAGSGSSGGSSAGNNAANGDSSKADASSADNANKHSKDAMADILSSEEQALVDSIVSKATGLNLGASAIEVLTDNLPSLYSSSKKEAENAALAIAQVYVGGNISYSSWVLLMEMIGNIPDAKRSIEHYVLLLGHNHNK